MLIKYADWNIDNTEERRQRSFFIRGYCSSIKSNVTHASEKATVYVKIR